MARVLAIPPWWGRPSYTEAFPFGAFGNPLPSLGAALLALAAVAAVPGWRWHAAQRRSAGEAAVAVVGAGVLIVLSLLPAGGSGPADGAERRRRWMAVSLAAVTAAVSLANVPASDQGTTAPGWTVPVARRLDDAVAAAGVEGPLLVTCGEHVVDPYCEAVMAELQRRDVPFVVDGDIELRQLGEGRRWTGDNAEAELTIVTGDYAVFPPADQEVVTLQRGLSENDERELFFLRQELVAPSQTAPWS